MVGTIGRPVANIGQIVSKKICFKKCYKEQKEKGTRPLDILQTRRCQPGANIGQIIIKANRRSDSEKETMSADAGIIWQSGNFTRILLMMDFYENVSEKFYGRFCMLCQSSGKLGSQCTKPTTRQKGNHVFVKMKLCSILNCTVMIEV